MKIKIILTNLVVVLLIGFGIHIYLKSSLTSDFAAENASILKSDRYIFRDMFMLRGYQLMAEAQRKAASPDAKAVFDPLPPTEEEATRQLRARAFIMVDKYASEELRVDPQYSRKPELVVITNPKGVVIARDTDANANVGEVWADRFNLVNFALNGRAKWDLVEYQGMILQAAAAPIVREEGTVGCLLVGFEVDNGYMDRESKLLKSDLGFVIPKLLGAEGKKKAEPYRVYASSFDEDAKRKALAQYLGANEEARVAAALDGNKDSDLFALPILGESFLATIAPLPGSYQAGKVGYVALRSVDAANAPLGHLWMVVVFTACGALLVILLGILLGTLFIKPVVALEAEVRKVIEGDYEHRWEIKSSEVGGLSYLINQTLDVLTGEEEQQQQEEEDEVSEASMPSQRLRIKTEEEFMREGEASSMTMTEIMAEPEDQYYKRIYREFRELKGRLGEDPDAIGFDKFVEKLKETESSILSRQTGRFVRFQVQLHGTTISYKPVIIP